MSAWKHVSGISAESLWQEGIFLRILGGGLGASDHATGTPDGVQPARTIKMVHEFDAWDIELLLGVKELPWDCRRVDPATRIHLTAPEVPPEHVLPPPEGEPAAQIETSPHQTLCGNSQARCDDGAPKVHGHHSGNDE